MKQKKKLVFLIILLGLSHIASSQSFTNKGLFSINGDIDLSKTIGSSNEFNNKSFSINTYFMYFIANKLAIGPSINYKYDKTKYNFNIPNPVYGNRTYAIGPFVRYYLGDTNFYPFLNLAYYYSKNKDLRENFVYTNHDFNVGAGFNITITSNLVFETNLNYHFNKTSHKQESSNYKNISLHMGLGVFF